MPERSGVRRFTFSTACLVLAACVNSLHAQAAFKPPAGQGFKVYETRYYVIHTDLDEETVREAAARMTATAEEYHRRTKDFAGAIRTKFPFYLFSSRDQYAAAGGLTGSAGVFTGTVLMAVAVKDRMDVTWHTLRHEAFHQFAREVITRNLPVWVNEGLAEYFGQGIWTGDGLVVGMVSPSRLKRVQAMIRDQKLLPLADMLAMEHNEWNKRLDIRNYDQAWSMVHFLVHADNGKYQAAFAGFINDLARNKGWRDAFPGRFGRDVDAFQKRYCQWWTQQTPEDSAEVARKAVVQTLTSFLGRAVSQGQQFKTYAEFRDAARENQLKTSEKQRLPVSLLKDVLPAAERMRDWSLTKGAGGVSLILTEPGGTKMVGTFGFQGTQVVDVKVTVTQAASKPATN